MPLPRPCARCGGRFNPETKYQRLCNECRKKVKNVNFIKLICHRRDINLKELNKFW